MNMNWHEIFKNAFSGVDAPLEGMAMLMSGLCGIAALAYIGSKVWSQLAQNESIDIYPLLRPLFIGIICVNFNATVVKPIEWAMSPLINYTQNIKQNFVLSNPSDYSAMHKKMTDANEEKVKNESAEIGTDEDENKGGWFKKIFGGGVVDSVVSFFQSPGSFLFKVLSWFITFLAELLSMLLVAIGMVLQKIFILFGPVAFAIGIFPAYKQNITSWLAQYIGLFLWFPIINVLCGIQYAISNQVSFTAEAEMVALIMSAIILFLYLMVPKFAGVIIQGGEVALPAVANSIASFGGTVVGSTAGVAAGAAAGAAKKFGKSLLRK